MQEWRDPWGHPMRYSFAVSGPNYTLTVTTAGADGVFSTDVKKSFADGVVARFNTNYAQQIRRRLLDAAEEFYRSSGRYPDSEADIEAAIRQIRIPETELTDPWGHRYYSVAGRTFQYHDSIIVRLLGTDITYGEFLELQRRDNAIVPS